MSTSDVVRVVGVNRSTLFRWCKKGLFPPKHISGGWLRSDWRERNQRARKNHSGYPVLPLVAPTEVVANQFTLEHGDIWRFYLGPTHTCGDIFVYFPREQVLDAGSILKPRLGNLADADLRAYPKTLRKLQQMHLRIRTVIAGHWSAVHGPDLIQRYVRMLKQHVQGDHE